MDTTEYIIYSVKNRLIQHRGWMTSMLTILGSDTDYVKIIDGYYNVVIDNKNVPISKTGKLILSINDSVVIPPNTLMNQPKAMTTTYGLIIANHLILEIPFGSKIDYINESFDIEDIEGILKVKLIDGSVTIDEYLVLGNTINYIKYFSRLLVTAVTEKRLLPPPGLIAERERVIKMLDKKHGEDWVKNYIHIETYIKELMLFDKKYLENDITVKQKTMNKKATNARRKLLLTFGAEPGMDPLEEASFVKNSLAEGWVLTPKNMAAYINTTRAVSYSRAKETAIGGTYAKQVLGATNGIIITQDDCGATSGIETTVDAYGEDSLVGRYYISGKKSILIKDTADVKKLKKTFVLRSASDCKTKNGDYCAICLGNKMSLNRKGLSAEIAKLPASILLASLKKMHSNDAQSTELDLDKLLS